MILDPKKPDCIPWPDTFPQRYNACTEPCDMFIGPCACGSWHYGGITFEDDDALRKVQMGKTNNVG